MGASRRQRSQKEESFLELVKCTLDDLRREVADIKWFLDSRRIASPQSIEKELSPPPAPPQLDIFDKYFLLKFRVGTPGGFMTDFPKMQAITPTTQWNPDAENFVPCSLNLPEPRLSCNMDGSVLYPMSLETNPEKHLRLHKTMPVSSHMETPNIDRKLTENDQNKAQDIVGPPQSEVTLRVSNVPEKYRLSDYAAGDSLVHGHARQELTAEPLVGQISSPRVGNYENFGVKSDNSIPMFSRSSDASNAKADARPSKFAFGLSRNSAAVLIQHHWRKSSKILGNERMNCKFCCRGLLPAEDPFVYWHVIDEDLLDKNISEIGRNIGTQFEGHFQYALFADPPISLSEHQFHRMMAAIHPLLSFIPVAVERVILLQRTMISSRNRFLERERLLVSRSRAVCSRE